MSLGALQNEGDLKRWVEQELDVLLGPILAPLLSAAGSRTRGEEAVTLSSGTTESSEVEVAHNLSSGDIPKVYLQVERPAGTNTYSARLTSRTNTHFKFIVNASTAPGEDVDLTVIWEAVI